LKKFLILAAILVAVTVFYSVDGSRYLSFGQFQQWVGEQPLKAGAIYFAAYIVITGLSLPGAAVMTMMGGALFGLGWGLLLVSFASTLGATLAFSVSRWLLRDWVQTKFERQLTTVNRGVEKDGPYYLFTLRLIPVIPFFVINLVFGLTPLKTWTFYWVSQLGMLAGTAVYVNAGAELGTVEELNASGIFTPGIVGAFLLLAMFPLLTRSLVARVQQHLRLRVFDRPSRFETNMVVIGAGSAGLVASYIAAAVKAKVTLVEKHQMGGDCLNTGCVPSKALIRSASVMHQVRRAEQFGLRNVGADVDFAAVMERVQRVVRRVEPHDSVERYRGLGVECVQGQARLLSPWQVQVGERVITSRNIVIASGARPWVPPIPGIDAMDYLTSDTLWDLREQPRRLLVMGAGPIGCELAQAFARLGSTVTLVDMAERILPREDEEVSVFVGEVFEQEGVDVRANHKTVAFRRNGEQKFALLERVSTEGVEQVEIGFDHLLVAVGRKANVEDMGLEELGLKLTAQGTLEVDQYMRTRFHNIFACGDVTGPYQFTHMASHQAWYACVNALFGRFKKFKVDYRVVPWATFTAPEVARVGLNEMEARQQEIPFEVSRYGIDDLDRAIADDEAQGFVKVITAKGSDKILGATIVGYHASDLITEFVTALKQGWGLNRILGTIHIYPTMSEANKYVAGNWKRAHAPAGVLRWVERFHRWSRS